MRLRSFALLVLLIVGIFCSCKKKSEQDDPYKRSDNLVIGDYTNILRHIYDTIIVYQGLPAGIDLDLDDDKIDDVRLLSTEWGSTGFGHHPRSEIYCLTKNVSISGYYTADTTLFSFDQSSYVYDSMVIIDEYYRFSCHKISDHDTILSIASNSFKILVKIQQDKINQQDIFNTDSITLNDESYAFPPYTINNEDTVIRRHEVIYNNCYTFPPNEVCYIAIKIMNGNDVKYGWIKLSVIDKNKITVFETAIQR